MNKIFIMLLILCLNGSIFANDSQTGDTSKVSPFQPNVNTVKISLKPEIVGLWGMDINIDHKQCTEYYNFKSNNELIVNSDKEWSTGFYEYEPKFNADNKNDLLTIHINYDNNEIDCSGIQVDQSDELSQYSVKWKSPISFDLCNAENIDECFASLRRILP